MTYQEILLCNALLEAIPVDNIQPMDIAADIILLQVSYQRKVNEFASFMQDSLKRMKSDKFDDLMINHKRFETLSNSELTDDEKNELTNVLMKISKLDIDVNSLLDQAKSLYDQIKNSDDAQGFFAKIFQSIRDFFKNLFNW